MNETNYNLSDWQNEYISFEAQNAKDANTCIDNFIRACKEKRLVLWGANLKGKAFYKLFLEIGLDVDAFIDRNFAEICELNGVKVHSPTQISRLFPKNEVVIIGSVHHKNFNEIEKEYQNIAPDIPLYNGSSLQYALQSSVCIIKSESGELDLPNCAGCEKNKHLCPILRKHLISVKPSVKIRESGVKLCSIRAVVGTVCTLNCKYCADHIPYTKKEHRSFVPKEDVIADIYTLSNICEFITVVELIGGEPLLHPDLHDIIKSVQGIRNIGIVNIVTNGTVMPDDTLLDQLSNPYTVVNISDYSVNLKKEQRNQINMTEKALLDANIMVYRAKGHSWLSSLSFDEVESDVVMLTKRFNKCCFADAQRLYRGKLFRCVHQYAGYISGERCKLDSNNIVMIHKDSETLKNEIERFIELPYIDTCRYCEMPFDSIAVSAGVQIS